MSEESIFDTLKNYLRSVKIIFFRIVNAIISKLKGEIDRDSFHERYLIDIPDSDDVKNSDNENKIENITENRNKPFPIYMSENQFNNAKKSNKSNSDSDRSNIFCCKTHFGKILNTSSESGFSAYKNFCVQMLEDFLQITVDSFHLFDDGLFANQDEIGKIQRAMAKKFCPNTDEEFEKHIKYFVRSSFEGDKNFLFSSNILYGIIGKLFSSIFDSFCNG